MIDTSKLVLLLTLVLCPFSQASAESEQADDVVLSVETIFDTDAFASKGYSARWHSDDAYIRLENSENTTGKDIVKYDVATAVKSVLVPASDFIKDNQSRPLAIDGYSFSDDQSMVLIYTNSQRVWRQKSRGDYWVLDRGSHQLWQIASDAAPATTMFAKFSPQGDRVAYVRDGDIYVDDLRDRTTRRLTNKPNDNVINGTFDWTYEEEFGVRDGFRWSPDGQRIAFWQLDTTGVQTFTMINNTDSLYPKTIEFAHSKVGQRNSACRVLVMELASKTTTVLEVPGDASDNYIARMEWIDSETLALQHLNRLQNTQTLLFADAASGRVEKRLTEQDDAWVDVHDETLWFAEQSKFTWISDRDGWRRPYLATRSSGTLTRLTSGEHDAIQVLRVDEQQQCVYYIASPANATQRYLHRASLDGKSQRRVTPKDATGWHDYSISPNGKWALHTFSSAGVPPTVQLISLPDHRVVRVLEENSELKEKLAKLKLEPVEFLQVPAANGQLMDAWCIKPAQRDESKKLPLLVYVYGEPAGSTVVDRWGGSSYLWHQLMAQHGYVVMSFDNRGTKVPRGRNWRKSIYRQVGVIAPQDQAAAVTHVLEQRDYLDKDRVGIWGWSGGGSMSLNAVFKYPDLYKTAVSIAPVPNQRYYDTIYQERYMGLPNDNSAGYLEGSPINFAHQLKGNLLLIHGTGDDNCHYQTMELLINELIRHKKQFSMMAYPNRTHSIREGENTTFHLRTLMTEYIKANL